MDRDLEDKAERLSVQQERAPGSHPLAGLSSKPGVLTQRSKASTMPRKVSRGRAVSRAILLTLAVTTQYVSRVPGAPSHTEELCQPQTRHRKRY